MKIDAEANVLPEIFIKIIWGYNDFHSQNEWDQVALAKRHKNRQFFF